MSAPIHLLRRDELDDDAYHQCLREDIIDGRGQIYPEIAWLDAVAPGWKCLVYGDYEAVLPHYVVRKYGVPCVIMPSMTQQLGVYGQDVAIEDIFRVFYRRYLYIDYQTKLGTSQFTHRSRTNLVSKIYDDEDSLLKTWKKRHQRAIQKAIRKGFAVEEVDDRPSFIAALLSDLNIHYMSATNALKGLFKMDDSRIDLRFYKAIKDDQTCGYSIVAATATRVHPVYTHVPSIDAKRDGLVVLLHYHSMIKYIGRSMIYDFEGSDLPNIYNFYQGFGAYEEPYDNIRKRPWPMR